jgi:hypothetical protein
MFCINEWMNERLTLVTSKSIFVGGTLHSGKTDPIWRKTKIAENAKNLFEFILNFFLQVTLVEAVIGKWSDIVNFLYLLLIWLHYINLGVMKVVFSLIWNLTLIKLRLNINWNLNRSVIWVEKDFSDYSKNIPPGKNPGARLFLRFKVVK